MKQTSQPVCAVKQSIYLDVYVFTCVQGHNNEVEYLDIYELKVFMSIDEVMQKDD